MPRLTRAQKDELTKDLDLISDVVEERARIEGGYRLYEPSLKGEDMIRDFGKGDKFVYFISAANGFGKTCLMANMLASIIFENVNKYFVDSKIYSNEFWDELRVRKNTPKRARIVCPNPTTDVVARELHHAFPEGRYYTKRMGYSYESRWYTDTGWEIQMMTSDQNPKQFESETLGLIMFDEVPPEAIYDGCIARMRQGGHILITATPIAGAGYLYDKFVDTNRQKDIINKGTGEMKTAERKVGYATATVYDAEVGVNRGHLERDDIDRIVSEIGGQYQQARIFGQFNQLSGTVFKNFVPMMHCITPFIIDRNSWSVTNLFDPHPSHPNAVLWVAQNEKGECIVVDELFEEVFSIEEFVFKIKEIDKKYRVTNWIIDSAAAKKDQNVGVMHAPIDIYTQMGLPYVAGPKKSVMQGIELIRAALSFSGSPEVPTSEPRLKIFETCSTLIQEMTRYRWEEKRDGQTSEAKPVDKDDHMIENLRRFFLVNPIFNQPKKQRWDDDLAIESEEEMYSFNPFV